MLKVIDPIARTEVEAKFGYTFADRLDVTWVAERQATNPDIDSSPRLAIAQVYEPTGIDVGLRTSITRKLYRTGYTCASSGYA